MYSKRKAYNYIISFFCVLALSASAQNQKIADSLVKIYQEDKLKDTAKLDLLRDLSFNETNYKVALKYAEILFSQANGGENFDNLYLARNVHGTLAYLAGRGGSAAMISRLVLS